MHRDADLLEFFDPLAVLLGALPPGGTFRYRYDDAVKLSGHSCPTVAGAWLMTVAAMRALYPDATPVRGDVEVTVGGERDGASAGPMSQVIALVTGAAAESGFGGLGGRFRRRGLLRFDPALDGRIRFRRRDSGAAVDVSYAPERVPPAEELRALLPRVLAEGASSAERSRFATLWSARVTEILNADPDRVLSVRVVE